MKTYDLTHVGKRTINQDQVAIVDKKQHQLLAIVCDGMGGHNSGELASKIVCEYLVDCYKVMPNFSSKEEAKEWLKGALIEANKITHRQAKTSALHSGMGTTAVVVLIYEDTQFVASVGDSRCYKITDEMVQLTNDDTFVNELIKSGVISKEEARFHPKRNVLMRAMGVNEEIEVVVQSYPLEEGYVLLCSDGLYNAVSDEQVKEVLQSKNALKAKCQKLVDLSLKQHGSDNISIALIEVERGDLNDW